jgi:hypothetical protein
MAHEIENNLVYTYSKNPSIKQVCSNRHGCLTLVCKNFFLERWCVTKGVCARFGPFKCQKLYVYANCR